MKGKAPGTKGLYEQIRNCPILRDAQDVPEADPNKNIVFP